MKQNIFVEIEKKALSEKDVQIVKIVV